MTPTPNTQEELCYCDRNNIGAPGVSCGDCPTRDYKREATFVSTQDVPLLSAEDAIGIQFADKDMGFKPCPKIAAIADGRAATYNTATHELVPIGTREAVERVIAEMLDHDVNQLGGYYRDKWADKLQRALEGGR